MKYLKKFENHAAYEAAKSGLILPNVSLCVNENEVHYNPSSPTPPTPSHDYVEIGGIKWATMNIGANSITDGGLYFQWGDTQGYTADQVTGSSTPHKSFISGDYKYSNGGSQASDMTKYNATDGKTVLDASDDAVTAAWGGNWRMPTIEECIVLNNAVNATWTDDYQGSGVAGNVCTDKTDNSKILFLPGGGFCDDDYIEGEGSTLVYWTSSISNDNSSAMSFSGEDTTERLRQYGAYVRGILDE